MSDHEQEPVTRDEQEWRNAIADQVRRNCTPSSEAYAKGGDFLIYAVADWIENPPEWSKLAPEAVPPSEQVKLDPNPWALPGSRRRTSIQAWHPNHGVSNFVPRRGYSQNLADYSPKDTK